MKRLSESLEKEDFRFRSPFSQEKEYLLFDAGHRTPVLWLVTIVSIVCPALTAFLVLRMTTESMISDMGSIAAGRVLQIALFLLSSVFVWVMCWLSGKYVLRITRLKDGSLRVSTWRMLLPPGIREYSRNDFTAPVYSRGRTLQTRAPYYSTRAEGRKLIIDQQGDFPLGEELAFEAIMPD